MRLKQAASGLAFAAAVAVAGLYRRDLVRAWARLARLERRLVDTAFGPLEFCEWGQGEPLLLVHGVVGGCDVPPSWRALVPAGYRIITPSRFGYLGSPLPEEPTAGAQADAFASLLDELGVERAPVLAFSAGSTSAVQLALRHPDRVSALVLVAANAPHDTPVTLVPRALGPLVFSQPVLWFLRVFLPSALAEIAGKPSDYELRDADRRTLETIFDSFFPVSPRTPGCVFDGYVGNLEIGNCAFEEVRVPVLGVHAVDDPLAPYDDARAMVGRIPGSGWVRVERGGHIFIHNDERALREVAAFLRANASCPAGELALATRSA
jgi:pimeloyl-ACP methyl ester carboxylesterase